MDTVARLLEDKPVFHSGGTRRWDALPATLRYLQGNVRPGMRTLETGCGASTVVFAARGAEHTSISPDAEEHLRVKAYCSDLGVEAGGVAFVAGFSDLVLPELCTERLLDIAFIDGAHAFPYPAVDWHYVTRALKVGGTLLLDDVHIPAVAWVYRFMLSDPAWRIDAVLNDRTAVCTLAAEPAPEDWTLQPFNDRPDYGFAPLARRLRLDAAWYQQRFRRRAARRFPRAAAAWKARLRPRTSSATERTAQ